MTDDYSRHSGVYLLKSKSEAPLRIQEAITQIERQFPDRKVQQIRSDGGGEFIGANLGEWLKARNIRHQKSCPYTPQQNGVAERRNGVLLGCMRTLLADSGLPLQWWGDAILTANELHNVLPSSATPGMVSPHEAWWGAKPDVGMYRSFGCQAMVLIPPAQRGSKAAPVSKKMIHIRHDMAAKGYLFYDPDTQQTMVSRDCWFLEMTPAYDSVSGPGEGREVFPHPESQAAQTPEEPPQRHPAEAQGRADEDEDTRPSHPPPRVPAPGGAPPGAPPQEVPARPEPGNQEPEAGGPPEGAEPRGEEQGSPPQREGAPLPYQPYVLGLPRDRRYSPPRDYTPPRTRSQTRGERAQHTSTESTIRVPESYQEARDSRQAVGWQEAEHKELETMLENGVWGAPVPRPPGKTVVGSKWVYAVKYTGTGEVDRLKARLVARGFSQQEGKDYFSDSIYAPTVRPETLKVLTHIGAQEGWSFRLMDVQGAYLAAELQEEVYLQQPQGYEDPQNPTGVLPLKKAIYGLKQSARAWYGRLSDFLLSIGFVVNPVDPSLFQRNRGERRFYIQVYVDDLGILHNNEGEFREFQEAMCQEFKMKDLGETKYYLGIHFEHHRDNKTVHMHQSLYIHQLLEKYKLQEGKVAPTPLEEGHTLTREEPWKPGEEGEMRGVPYAQLVGSLNYLSTCTRPDISYAVSLLSRYSREGKHQRRHWEAAKRVLRYLKGTPTVGVTLGGTVPMRLRASSDASLGDDLTDRRSTLAYCTSLGAGPVSWKSTRSKPVATSTAESEYYAAAAGGKEVVYLRKLLDSLGHKQEGPTPFGCDNQAAIAMAKNPEFHARTKHIDICYHWIRDAVKEGILQLEYIPSEANPADLLTKALGRQQHELLMTLLQVQGGP